VVKNKVAPPFKEAAFEIIYGQGISHAGELLALGVELGLLKKSGSWFSYHDERIGQGRESARRYLQENHDVALKLENLIRESYGVTPLTGAAAAAEEPAK